MVVIGARCVPCLSETAHRTLLSGMFGCSPGSCPLMFTLICTHSVFWVGVSSSGVLLARGTVDEGFSTLKLPSGNCACSDVLEQPLPCSSPASPFCSIWFVRLTLWAVGYICKIKKFLSRVVSGARGVGSRTPGRHHGRGHSSPLRSTGRRRARPAFASARRHVRGTPTRHVSLQCGARGVARSHFAFCSFLRFFFQNVFNP